MEQEQELIWSENQSPEQIIQKVLDEGRRSFYCLLSGGKDSVATTHFISQNYPNQFKGCIYTVTGIGLDESRLFVRDYCKEMNWPLQFTWSPYSFTADTLKEGFAGPDQHNVVMFRRKFITWRYFEREHRNEDMIFVGGVRRKESKRRQTRKSFRTPFMKDGKTQFVNPFFYFNGNDIWKYHGENGLKLTPVHQILNISGDCLCGCFAEKWELQLIKKYYPRFFEYIKWLENQIQIKGSKKARKFPTWAHANHRLSTYDVENQTLLEDFGDKGDYLCSESCVVE